MDTPADAKNPDEILAQFRKDSQFNRDFLRDNGANAYITRLERELVSIMQTPLPSHASPEISPKQPVRAYVVKCTGGQVGHNVEVPVDAKCMTVQPAEVGGLVTVTWLEEIPTVRCPSADQCKVQCPHSEPHAPQNDCGNTPCSLFKPPSYPAKCVEVDTDTPLAILTRLSTPAPNGNDSRRIA